MKNFAQNFLVMILVLTSTSISIASDYYWRNGTGAGSSYYWRNGTSASIVKMPNGKAFLFASGHVVAVLDVQP